MKQLKFIILILFLLLFFYNSYSQEYNEIQTKNPQAKVTFKTQQTKSILIEQINYLTNYDEVLTEKVVKQLYSDNNYQEVTIISDEKYKELDEKQKFLFIKESEVIKIINSLK